MISWYRNPNANFWWNLGYTNLGVNSKCLVGYIWCVGNEAYIIVLSVILHEGKVHVLGAFWNSIHWTWIIRYNYHHTSTPSLLWKIYILCLNLLRVTKHAGATLSTSHMHLCFAWVWVIKCIVFAIDKAIPVRRKGNGVLMGRHTTNVPTPRFTRPIGRVGESPCALKCRRAPC